MNDLKSTITADFFNQCRVFRQGKHWRHSETNPSAPFITWLHTCRLLHLHAASLTTLPNDFHVWHCLMVPGEDRVIDSEGPTKPVCPQENQRTFCKHIWWPKERNTSYRGKTFTCTVLIMLTADWVLSGMTWDNWDKNVQTNPANNKNTSKTSRRAPVCSWPGLLDQPLIHVMWRERFELTEHKCNFNGAPVALKGTLTSNDVITTQAGGVGREGRGQRGSDSARLSHR